MEGFHTRERPVVGLHYPERVRVNVWCGAAATYGFIFGLGQGRGFRRPDAPCRDRGDP
jgi:hypothetical protein